LSERQHAAGGVDFRVNRTYDTSALLLAYRREGVTDMLAFANARRANQIGTLTEAAATNIEQLSINGRSAYRWQVTGTTKEGSRLTYLVTIIEGPTEIAALNTWTNSGNFEPQKARLSSLAELVSGF
jgi:hypothetical protein